MTAFENENSIAAARQSINPSTNEEKGNVMPDEEKMAEAFKLTASHNIDDPKDKTRNDDDDKDNKENANNGDIDDEEVTDEETKKGFHEMKSLLKR